MADLSPEQAIEKLRALPEDKQRAVLTALSPDERKGIMAKLSSKQTATPAPPPESTLKKVGRGAALGAFEGLGVKPAASTKEVLTGTAGQLKEGVKSLLSDTWKANAASGRVAGPVGQAVATGLDLIPAWFDKTATSLEEGGRQTIQDIKNEDYEAAAEHGASTLTSAAMLRSPRRALEEGELNTVGTLRGKARDLAEKHLGPREVPIAGEKVPVLVGEAKPASVAGRAQTSLKKAGIGAQKFKNFSAEQTARVKEVIRKVAQQTSGAIGPMAEEPGKALSNAADATFEKARPMYQALDESLTTVPDSLSQVSKVTEQAMQRARKLGIEINTEGESVMVNGRKFTPQTDPEAWARFKEQGLVGPAAGGQPISTYMKVRSELLKMQRGSADAAMRNNIGNELKAMNANMESALKDTPLLDSWNEANRLWSKGYAIRDVADALKESTEGTPAAQQAPGLAKVQTEIKGPKLVAKLNDLANDGILDRAFSPEEVRNLRQAADILDRATGSPGTEFGVGYGAHSTFWRNLVKQPFYPLVTAMTRLDGVKALQAGMLARDAGTAAQAFDRFSRIVGAAGVESSGVKNRKDALDLLGTNPQ